MCRPKKRSARGAGTTGTQTVPDEAVAASAFPGMGYTEQRAQPSSAANPRMMEVQSRRRDLQPTLHIRREQPAARQEATFRDPQFQEGPEVRESAPNVTTLYRTALRAILDERPQAGGSSRPSARDHFSPMLYMVWYSRLAL